MPPQETKGDSILVEPTSLLGDKKAPVEYTDAENKEVKLKYPKSVFFIISNEFCERFCFYGMRTILALYLVQYLNYDDDTSTVVYHAFVMFAYFTPIFGAMIADSWLGRFRTIIYLSIVYAVGSIIVSLAAMPNVLPAEAFTYIGLALIAVGTGGIKPCVSSFGGDQFVVPQQERLLQMFFSVFYFSVNLGSTISTFITPILRQDVHCFGLDSCYSLAFGVPAVLMIVSIVIFLCGKPLYKVKKPEGNVLLKVSKCIGHAISNKVKSTGAKKDHWLDHAADQYDTKLIEDIKGSLSVLVMFIPLPVFWALFDQQGSRWTFQATRMDGVTGSFTIKPDQVQVLNPLLILVLIPLIEAVIYPCFKKINFLQSPIKRMVFGGSLASVAFVISALVELMIEPTLAVIPGAGESQLRLFNSVNCSVIVDSNGAFSEKPQEVAPLDLWELQHLKAQGNKSFSVTFSTKPDCPLTFNPTTRDVYASEMKPVSYVISDDGTSLELGDYYTEDLVKSNKGNAKLKVAYNLPKDNTAKTISFLKESDNIQFTLSGSGGNTQPKELDVGDYFVKLDSDEVTKISLKAGGVYTFMLYQAEDNKISTKMSTITEPNTVHILWLVPQYVILTFGEVMYSVTGLEFAFTQAPLSMKSVITAGWLLTVAFGNIIVIIVAESKFFDKQIFEFILFAGLMALDMLIFSLMGMRYKYVSVASEESESSDGIAMEKAKSQDNDGYDNHKD